MRSKSSQSKYLEKSKKGCGEHGASQIRGEDVVRQHEREMIVANEDTIELDEETTNA